jgi:hypothetical protein
MLAGIFYHRDDFDDYSDDADDNYGECCVTINP